jgi:hypothetical protein
MQTVIDGTSDRVDARGLEESKIRRTRIHRIADCGEAGAGAAGWAASYSYRSDSMGSNRAALYAG